MMLGIPAAGNTGSNPLLTGLPMHGIMRPKRGISMTEREDIDDSLQEEAMRIGCLKTREETVNQVQREFIERLEAEKLIAAFGTVDFDEGYDYKTERKRRA